MTTRESRVLWILILVVLGVSLLMVMGASRLRQELSNQAGLPRICRRYQIDIGTPNVEFISGRREAIVFENISRDSPMAKAGIRVGDVVLEPHWLGDLARALDEPAGAVVELLVAQVGPSGVTDDRSPLRIRIVAP